MFVYNFECLCVPKATTALFYVISYSGQRHNIGWDKGNLIKFLFLLFILPLCPFAGLQMKQIVS